MASTDALTMRGHSAAWALPLTVTGSSITAVGTAIEFKAIGRHEPVFAAVAAEGGAAGDVVSAPLADGVTIEVNRVTRKIEGTTGLNKANTGGGAGGAAGDLIRWTTLLTGRTKVVEAAAMRGKPYLVCIPTADSVAASEEGFYYLIGTMVSEIAAPGEPETIGSFVLEFQGGSAYTSGFAGADEDAKNTAMAAAAVFPAITPISNTTEYTTAPIQPPSLVLADMATLLKGEIVIKAAA